MLEDFRLRVFMTVAEECSFTKAAVRLSISQPAVSQNVSELERLTGVRLFDRLRGEVRLTSQGEIFRSYAVRILDSYKAASLMFSEMPPAVVRIKASDEVYSLVSDAFALFHEIHGETVFIRSDEEDSELSFVLKPASKTMGGVSATHNIISSMSLICRPSESFAQSELFPILRGFISDIIC